MYERPPIDLRCTIKVRNLCKTFATEASYEISLDNISVDIFEVSNKQLDMHFIIKYVAQYIVGNKAIFNFRVKFWPSLDLRVREKQTFSTCLPA